MQRLDPVDPVLVFVATDYNARSGGRVYKYLRHAIWTAREVCHWPGRIHVLDAGLHDWQREVLSQAGVSVSLVEQQGHARALQQPYMWKIWADLLLMHGDPIVVADADIEFRDPNVLNWLLDTMADNGGQCFICQEPQTWHACLHPFIELNHTDAETALYLMNDITGVLFGRPVLNAGLFGGPRDRLSAALKWVRRLVPSLMHVFAWYWEQLALSIVLRERGDVVELPPVYNWLTAWGRQDAAKVLHFHSEIHNEWRHAVPDAYLRPGHTAQVIAVK